MRHESAPLECAPVLRQVMLQDLPHALMRPNDPVPAEQRPGGETAASQFARGQASQREQAFAEGYRQGVAEGARQVTEAQVAVHGAADEARQAAFEQGRLDGLRRAEEEVASEIRQVHARLESEAQAVLKQGLDRLHALMDAIAPQMQQLRFEMEDDLLALSHHALCHMLGEKAAAPEILHGMVRELLARAPLHGDVRAHVHPDDFAALSGQTPGPKDWIWVADAGVQMGGVRLHSAEGSLDARLEVQLEVLRHRLLQVRDERRGALAAPGPRRAIHTGDGLS